MKLIALLLVVALCGCAAKPIVTSGYLGRNIDCRDGRLIGYFDDGSYAIIRDQNNEEVPCE